MIRQHRICLLSGTTGGATSASFSCKAAVLETIASMYTMKYWQGAGRTAETGRGGKSTTRRTRQLCALDVRVCTLSRSRINESGELEKIVDTCACISFCR